MSRAITEIVHIIHTEFTSYRVRSNPDGEAPDGKEGIALDWSDDGGKTWQGYHFIAPEAIAPLRDVLSYYVGLSEAPRSM